MPLYNNCNLYYGGENKVFMENYLENSIINQSYDDITEWHLPQLKIFSKEKILFEYQREALKNITKILYNYYTAEKNNGKKKLYEQCKQVGMLKNFTIKNDNTSRITKRLELFSEYDYPIINDSIPGYSFFNRACFWMATGSGKSLVLIKTIELLDYLQTKNLIDKREIMLLLPREDLIQQFSKEVAEFNQKREKKIALVNLKKYEDDQRVRSMISTIKVYYYRSDLLRDEKKESIIDFKTYDNNGAWYLFLDEAHRGEKQNSKIQDYVTLLSRNGFTFHFSATFTEEIDYATTCFNFNLERFIQQGYGKNIYLSNSYFQFNKDKDEFAELEKQKQVLKSLLNFTIVKQAKQKKQNLPYHAPLLMTLVNSINTKNSDLLLFFKKLEEISSGKLDQTLLKEVKNELQKEWQENDDFVFGNEKLTCPIPIQEIQAEDILEQVFHSRKIGKIELIEGETRKEIVLKLETADKPFALIKIGDAKKFEREKLGSHYYKIPNYDSKKFFANLNEEEDINLLLGSRSFYEGWDSNRPNIVNFINIGKGSAKKFVLQALGRGIRIEPKKGMRKRANQNEKLKMYQNKLLETLFVYATDKSSIKAIIETVQQQKENIFILPITKNKQTKLSFDLLIPQYKEKKIKKDIIFFIAEESLKKLQFYFSCFDKNTLLLLGRDIEIIKKLTKDLEKKQNLFQDSKIFEKQSQKNYRNIKELLDKLFLHLSAKEKIVDKVKKLENEIIHFKHVKIAGLSGLEKDNLKEKIKKVENFSSDKIKEYTTGYRDVHLEIMKLSNHYYIPLILSQKEKANYIQHIIKNKSEKKFVQSLAAYTNKKKDNNWMFSRIDEALDKFFIPYYCQESYQYKNFYPDFVFWMNKENNYKITFVDPKGIVHADYQKKIDGFKELFIEKNQPKEFSYGKFKITFDLKMVGKKNDVGKEYRKYWINEEDFQFLEWLNL